MACLPEESCFKALPERPKRCMDPPLSDGQRALHPMDRDQCATACIRAQEDRVQRKRYEVKQFMLFLEFELQQPQRVNAPTTQTRSSNASRPTGLDRVRQSVKLPGTMEVDSCFLRDLIAAILPLIDGKVYKVLIFL